MAAPGGPQWALEVVLPCCLGGAGDGGGGVAEGQGEAAVFDSWEAWWCGGASDDEVMSEVSSCHDAAPVGFESDDSGAWGGRRWSPPLDVDMPCGAAPSAVGFRRPPSAVATAAVTAVPSVAAAAALIPRAPRPQMGSSSSALAAGAARGDARMVCGICTIEVWRSNYSKHARTAGHIVAALRAGTAGPETAEERAARDARARAFCDVCRVVVSSSNYSKHVKSARHGRMVATGQAS